MDREGDEVVAFIQKQGDKKFFIHWAPYAVHTPIMGKGDLIEKHEQKEKGNQGNPVYAALVESLDQNIGKVIEELERLARGEPTTACRKSHRRWEQRLIPYRMTGNKNRGQIVGVDMLNLVLFLLGSPLPLQIISIPSCSMCRARSLERRLVPSASYH